MGKKLLKAAASFQLFLHVTVARFGSTSRLATTWILNTHRGQVS